MKKELRGLLDGLQPFSRVYLGLSGGADSMAMAHLLVSVLTQEEQKQVTLLHVDHGLRGDASRGDARFVTGWAEAQGLRLCLEEINVAERAKQRGNSLETEARLARYTFFERIIEKDRKAQTTSEGMGADKPLLLLAHHAEDQTESLFLHLIRGAGLSGLAGMQPVEEREGFRLIRPLLAYNKEDLLHYNRLHQVPWREDQTNYELDATRNQLRWEVLPRLRSINPSLDQAMMRFSDIVRQEDQLLDALAAREYARLTSQTAGRENEDSADILTASDVIRTFLDSQMLPKDAFLREDPAIQRRILRFWVRKVGKAGESIPHRYEDIERLRALFSAPAGKMLSLYGMMFLTDFLGVHMLTEQQFASVSKNNPEPFVWEPKSCMDAQSVENAWGTWSLRHMDELSAQQRQDMQTSGPDICYLDVTHLKQLQWRTASTEEVWQKFGGGSRPMRRMWNEWHVPEVLRHVWPVLSDGRDLIWVPALGRSAFRPAQPDRAVLIIQWRKK